MGPGDDASVSDLGTLSQQFDDSDYEDDEDNMDNDADFSSDEPDRHEMLGTGPTDGGPLQLDTPTPSTKLECGAATALTRGRPIWMMTKLVTNSCTLSFSLLPPSHFPLSRPDIAAVQSRRMTGALPEQP